MSVVFCLSVIFPLLYVCVFMWLFVYICVYALCQMFVKRTLQNGNIYTAYSCELIENESMANGTDEELLMNI